MTTPVEGDNRLGQSEEAFQKERELIGEDPVRRDELNAILQRKGADNPQAPQNIDQLMQGLAELYRKLSSEQRSGLAKILPHLGQTNPTPEELESLTEELLQAHEINEVLKSRQGQPEQPINYTQPEMPPGNPDPRLDPNNINRSLLDQAFRGPLRDRDAGSDEEKVMLYNPNYQQEMPVFIKNTLEAMQKEMRARLNRAESFQRGFSDPMSGVAEPLQEVVMWIRALEHSGNKSLNSPGEEEKGKEHIRWAKELRDEFDARAFLHEFFIYFLGKEDENNLFDNSQMMKSKYFNTYFKFKGVQEAIILLENNAERYLRSRGEIITPGGVSADQAETKGDVKLAITKEMAKIVADENEKAKIDTMSDDEIIRNYGWAFNMAERVWRISARPAMNDQLEQNGDEPGFISEAYNHDLLYRRALNVVNGAIANKKGFNLWPPLLAGVDLSNKDFFSRALRFIEDVEKPNVEAQILSADYGGRKKGDLSRVEKEEFDSKIEKALFEYFRDEYGYVKDYNEKTNKYSWPSLKATKQEIEEGMVSGRGQDTVKFAQKITEKTWRGLFKFNWEKISETSYRGWHYMDVVYVEKLRKQHFANERAQESFLANPGAKTLANVYKEIQYRSGSIPGIMTQLLENTWTYMAHERKQHTGVHNAGWDELESMLANAIESNVVTHGQAREAMKKAVKNDLLILYKDVEKYFSWWQFLLGLIFDTLKAGLAPERG